MRNIFGRKTFVLPLLFLPLTLALTLAIAGCGGGGYSANSSSPIIPALTSAPVGVYGANNIQIQVTAAGAQVTLQCGQSGQITQPLTLDTSGHFDVAGTLTPFQGAPGPKPSPVPARFTGTTDGVTMKMTITPTPVLAPATGYALTFGAAPPLDAGVCPG